MSRLGGGRTVCPKASISGSRELYVRHNASRVELSAASESKKYQERVRLTRFKIGRHPCYARNARQRIIVVFRRIITEAYTPPKGPILFNARRLDMNSQRLMPVLCDDIVLSDGNAFRSSATMYTEPFIRMTLSRTVYPVSEKTTLKIWLGQNKESAHTGDML